MKMSKVTENSWLVNDGHKTIALLCKTNLGFSIFKNQIRENFETFDEAWKSIGKPKITEITNTSSVKNIQGYPCRHDDLEILSDQSFPCYKHKQTVFAAGYWVLKFENAGGYSILDCPKASTILRYMEGEHKPSGPFKSRIEARQEQNILNKFLGE